MIDETNAATLITYAVEQSNCFAHMYPGVPATEPQGYVPAPQDMYAIVPTQAIELRSRIGGDTPVRSRSGPRRASCDPGFLLGTEKFPGDLWV